MSVNLVFWSIISSTLIGTYLWLTISFHVQFTLSNVVTITRKLIWNKSRYLFNKIRFHRQIEWKIRSQFISFFQFLLLHLPLNFILHPLILLLPLLLLLLLFLPDSLSLMQPRAGPECRPPPERLPRARHYVTLLRLAQNKMSKGSGRNLIQYFMSRFCIIVQNFKKICFYKVVGFLVTFDVWTLPVARWGSSYSEEDMAKENQCFISAPPNSVKSSERRQVGGTHSHREKCDTDRDITMTIVTERRTDANVTSGVIWLSTVQYWFNVTLTANTKDQVYANRNWEILGLKKREVPYLPYLCLFVIALIYFPYNHTPFICSVTD